VVVSLVDCRCYLYCWLIIVVVGIGARLSLLLASKVGFRSCRNRWLVVIVFASLVGSCCCWHRLFVVIVVGIVGWL